MKFIKKDLLILTVIFFIMTPLVSKAQVAIIGNKGIKTGSIDHNTVVNLYTLMSNELGSQKVKLFFLTTDNETTKKFLASINKTSNDLNKIWLRAKLTGNGAAPELVSSERDLISKVASTPGAVGFIDPKNTSGEVKVLLQLH